MQEEKRRLWTLLLNNLSRSQEGDEEERLECIQSAAKVVAVPGDVVFRGQALLCVAKALAVEEAAQPLAALEESFNQILHSRLPMLAELMPLRLQAVWSAEPLRGEMGPGFADTCHRALLTNHRPEPLRSAALLRAGAQLLRAGVRPSSRALLRSLAQRAALALAADAFDDEAEEEAQERQAARCVLSELLRGPLPKDLRESLQELAARPTDEALESDLIESLGQVKGPAAASEAFRRCGVKDAGNDAERRLRACTRLCWASLGLAEEYVATLRGEVLRQLRRMLLGVSGPAVKEAQFRKRKWKDWVVGFRQKDLDQNSQLQPHGIVAIQIAFDAAWEILKEGDAARLGATWLCLGPRGKTSSPKLSSLDGLRAGEEEAAKAASSGPRKPRAKDSSMCQLDWSPTLMKIHDWRMQERPSFWEAPPRALRRLRQALRSILRNLPSKERNPVLGHILEEGPVEAGYPRAYPRSTMGAYKYLEEMWRKKQSDVMRFLARLRNWEFRQLPAVHRCSRPTRPDKARKVGYKAKQGYCVYRVRVKRGDRKKRVAKGIVYGKPVNQGINKWKAVRNLRSIAEERVGRKCGSLRVLNSYWVAQDAVHKWYEVVMVDPFHKCIRDDPRINWICKPVMKHRELRGLTAAGRKARGLLKKGKRANKQRPSSRAVYRRHSLMRLRSGPRDMSLPLSLRAFRSPVQSSSVGARARLQRLRAPKRGVSASEKRVMGCSSGKVGVAPGFSACHGAGKASVPRAETSGGLDHLDARQQRTGLALAEPQMFVGSHAPSWLVADSDSLSVSESERSVNLPGAPDELSSAAVRIDLDAAPKLPEPRQELSPLELAMPSAGPSEPNPGIGRRAGRPCQMNPEATAELGPEASPTSPQCEIRCSWQQDVAQTWQRGTDRLTPIAAEAMRPTRRHTRANDSEMAGSDSESDPVLESFMQQLFAPIFGDGHLTPGSGQLPGLDADWRLLVLRAASLEVPETLSLLPDMQTVRLELRASKTAVRWWQALLACAAHAPMAERQKVLEDFASFARTAKVQAPHGRRSLFRLAALAASQGLLQDARVLLKRLSSYRTTAAQRAVLVQLMRLVTPWCNARQETDGCSLLARADAALWRLRCSILSFEGDSSAVEDVQQLASNPLFSDASRAALRCHLLLARGDQTAGLQEACQEAKGPRHWQRPVSATCQCPKLIAKPLQAKAALAILPLLGPCVDAATPRCLFGVFRDLEAGDAVRDWLWSLKAAVTSFATLGRWWELGAERVRALGLRRVTPLETATTFISRGGPRGVAFHADRRQGGAAAARGSRVICSGAMVSLKRPAAELWAGVEKKRKGHAFQQNEDRVQLLFGLMNARETVRIRREKGLEGPPLYEGLDVPFAEYFKRHSCPNVHRWHDRTTMGLHKLCAAEARWRLCETEDERQRLKRLLVLNFSVWRTLGICVPFASELGFLQDWGDREKARIRAVVSRAFRENRAAELFSDAYNSPNRIRKSLQREDEAYLERVLYNSGPKAVPDKEPYLSSQHGLDPAKWALRSGSL
ncbi:unnamed protein product [Effrenium voratum]|nr:unnamed protein product [Effrenium voratum]